MKLNDVEQFIQTVSEDDARLIRKLAHKRYMSFKKPDKVEAYALWDLKVAMRMDQIMRKTFPKLKSRTREDLKKWAVDIRKLRTIDKYDEDTIIEVVKFALNDLFWKKNILSAAKLRQKFDNLLAAYETGKPKMTEVELVKRQKETEIPKELPVVDESSPGYIKYKKAREKLAQRKAVS
jgi:hypothetical protein